MELVQGMGSLVDASGTTVYTYNAAGQLLTEDGPFASDTVTNEYSNRLRTKLSVQQPTSFWTNGFAYDAAKRLTNVRFGAWFISVWRRLCMRSSYHR